MRFFSAAGQSTRPPPHHHPSTRRQGVGWCTAQGTTGMERTDLVKGLASTGLAV